MKKVLDIRLARIYLNSMNQSNLPITTENPASLTIKQILDGLRAAKQKMPNGDNFAASLLAGYEKYGKLTPNQMPWAEKIAREIMGGSSTAQTRTGEDLGGDFTKVIEKFKIAKANGLKRPALTFRIPGAMQAKLRIYPAPDTGKNPGFLYVKGEMAYFGKINNKGEFFKGRDCTDNISDFLKNLAANPVEFCARQGRETGNCCFCARELSDARSLKVGYGRICSNKFSLPWGDE